MVAKALCSNELRLIAGRANPELAKEIASILGVPLCDIRINTFADTETHVQIEESGPRQGRFYHPADLSAGKRNPDGIADYDRCLPQGLRHVRLRQSFPISGTPVRTTNSTGREPVTAKMVADMFTTAGVNPRCIRRPARRHRPRVFSASRWTI